MKKKTIIGIIIALIVLIGILITCIWGFHFDLIYASHKEVDIAIGQEFENQEIYDITKEIVGSQKIIIQKVELYEDMVAIHVKDITAEQLENLNTKINEKYGIENTVENIVVTSVPNARGRDLVKPYMMPVTISFVIIILYLIIYTAIYSHIGIKVSVTKTVGKAIGMIIGVQLLYLALLAITRLPINRLTIPFSIVLYILTTIGFLLHLEKIIDKNNHNEWDKNKK